MLSLRSFHGACGPMPWCGCAQGNRRSLRCSAASFGNPSAERPAAADARGIFDLKGQCGDNVTLFDARCEADSDQGDVLSTRQHWQPPCRLLYPVGVAICRRGVVMTTGMPSKPAAALRVSRRPRALHTSAAIAGACSSTSGQSPTWKTPLPSQVRAPVRHRHAPLNFERASSRAAPGPC